jgi:hypothetical protein
VPCAPVSDEPNPSLTDAGSTISISRSLSFGVSGAPPDPTDRGVADVAGAPRRSAHLDPAHRAWLDRALRHGHHAHQRIHVGRGRRLKSRLQFAAEEQQIG